jgi:hypothetical protein
MTRNEDQLKGEKMTLHEHIQKHWKTAAVVVVGGFVAYSISYFW